MPITILSIETATRICSVGVSCDGKSLSVAELNEDGAHSSQLTLLIQQVLREANIEIPQLDAIAVSMGPGSYTGLRIGASTAKGLCYATKKPLIAVSTLQNIALGAIDFCKQNSLSINNALFCPMIDARRMEVYTALFSASGDAIGTTTPQIIDSNSFESVLTSHTVYFCGDGAQKCSSIITHPSAQFLNSVQPSAQWMAQLAYQNFVNNHFEDVAYFEPFYLKEFQTTTPKKKIF